MAFKRFIFFLLLPVTIYGQSKDTVSIILDEIEVKEEKLEASTALKSVDGMSIYSGKKK